MIFTDEEKYVSFIDIASEWAKEKTYTVNRIAYEMVEYSLVCGFQFEVDEKNLPYIDEKKS